jgi:hypothetical protein
VLYHITKPDSILCGLNVPVHHKPKKTATIIKVDDAFTKAAINSNSLSKVWCKKETFYFG